MATKETLNIVLQKVVQNKVNVNNALNQSRLSITQASPDALAAAKVLIKEFGNPQGAVQILQDAFQVEALADTAAEMDAMIALFETALVDGTILAATDAQLAARAEASKSPLSGAAGIGGDSTVADTGTPSEAATVAA
jgi:hypothetical protein